jgi:hypothetical protein
MQTSNSATRSTTDSPCLGDLWAELQQFLAEFWDELDKGGLEITRFYFSDGVFVAGDKTFTGHADIQSFYVDRAERVRTQQEGGVRTARHTFVNLRISLDDNDRATLNFMNITYAGAGSPPVQGLGGPSGISDCRMICERDTDGRWRLRLFAGAAIFLGNDSFVNKIALEN